MPTTIQAGQVRNSLGSMLNQVYYQKKTFQIKRNDTPMALVVPNISEADFALELFIKHFPSLADTLALETNPELQAIIQEAETDYVSGNIETMDEFLQRTSK